MQDISISRVHEFLYSKGQSLWTGMLNTPSPRVRNIQSWPINKHLKNPLDCWIFYRYIQIKTWPFLLLTQILFHARKQPKLVYPVWFTPSCTDKVMNYWSDFQKQEHTHLLWDIFKVQIDSATTKDLKIN